MELNGSYAKTSYLIQRGLGVSTLRHQVISNNIANATTPGFKRTDVAYEADLRRTLDAAPPALQAAMTEEKHIPFFRMPNIQDVTARKNVEFHTSYKNDESNVDMEKESVDMARNTMRYNAMASIMKNYFRRMDVAIRA